MFRLKHVHKGVSLIELMVAMAVSLFLVVAATYIFVGTRQSQRALDESSSANDVGAYLLRLIGREVASAGFYPAVSVEPGLTNMLNGYTNVTGLPAYDQGIFGCEGAQLNTGTGRCDSPVAGAPDTVVIGYFTNDAFNAQAGQRLDCEGNDALTFAVNTSRAGSGSATVSPALPLFVANHYSMQNSSQATTMTIAGQTVTTRSLVCKGLGSRADAAYRPLMSGIDDFQLSYGVFAAPDASGESPVQFMTADAVSALGSLEVDGVIYTPWRRVVAVRVCVVAKTFESRAVAAADAQQWQDCDGVTRTASDQSVRKAYSQVFSVRNHLNATY